MSLIPRFRRHVLAPVLTVAVAAVLAPVAPASAIEDGGQVYGGIYSTRWESGADLDALAAWAGDRITFAGSFHTVDENPRDNSYSNTRWILEEAWKARSTPFANIAVDATAASIARGDHDQAIRVWAQHVKGWLDQGEGRSLIVAPLQEMNGDWVRYGHDPANFPGAYRRFVTIFHELGLDETKVRFAFAPNGWSSPPYRIADYYPGDDIVDLIGFSAYNFGSGLTWDRRYHSVGEVLGPPLNELRTTVSANKPYIVAQTATSSVGGDKEQWLRDLFAYTAADPNVVGLIYFNVQKETDWPVWNGQTGSSGFADGLRAPTTAYAWPLTDWFQPGPLTLGQPAAAVVPLDNTRRVAGGSRIETAVELSKLTHDTADTVVIARSDNFPDALAGAPLAAKLGAPILLTSSARLDDVTRAEVQRLRASTAVLLGGESALTPQVEADLREAGVGTVERLAGDTRWATAAEIARRVGGNEVYVVEGLNPDPNRGWPDAVSVSPLAAFQERPILLVSQGELPPATAGALDDLRVRRATIVGGEGAVSGAVAGQIAALGVDVTRVAGDSRYATSALLADLAVAAGMSPQRAWLPTGNNWPDALAAAPAVAADGGVMLLVNGSDLNGSPQSRDWVAGHAVDEAIIVGGTGAVTRNTEAQISAATG